MHLPQSQLHGRPSARSRRRAPSRRGGMTLMEVVLALAVFSLAAISLVGTLNQIAEAGIDSRRMLEVDQKLESLIDEYSKMPQVRELEEQIKPDAEGIAYRVLITQVKDLKNQEGRFLQNTFRIQAIARWNEGFGPIEVQAETLRYAGSFLPIQ